MESNSNPNSVEGESRNWLELPVDVTSMILQKLGPVEILTYAQYVCSSWRKICEDPLMWRVIDMRYPCDWWDMDYDLEEMCRQAVKRSCGELIHINIEHFGTDDLLRYITQRLRLVYCNRISDEGLIEAVSKLPLLEDLELSFCSFNVETLGTLGQNCPGLKSLKLNRQFYRRVECDKGALAIADNMPNLRHLHIFGNNLTNRGLEAILHGCSALESLDLRQCFNLNLAGQLGAKCSEKIKDLRLPHDPTDDCEFTTEIIDDDDNYDDDYDYPFGLSDTDLLTDDDDYYEFSGGSDFSDYTDLYFY
ncbi:F-box protein SKIP19-like isoform X2 [Cucumis melo]|uniref:F-box protein SKIP19-like isoform X2 n=1 Tax=Cucumis melo TaxID=3656 RepID=A0A1S4DTF8_CUCME|nr:F-box protein SKIP19-like isoform X2 [Cucumis melo]